jgi:hypothetical protein
MCVGVGVGVGIDVGVGVGVGVGVDVSVCITQVYIYIHKYITRHAAVGANGVRPSTYSRICAHRRGARTAVCAFGDRVRGS